MVRALAMNPKVGDAPHSGRDTFCPKNVDTFTSIPVRVSKKNALAHAQLTFQMLTLLKKYPFTYLNFNELV